MIKTDVLRIKFIRSDEVKFISHLDIMRTFQRAMSRAGIPIAYSGGFNPSPRIIFGLPLSLGFSSDSEYADIELTERIETSEFIEKINSALPDALKVLKAAYVENSNNIMASIAMAEYEMKIMAPDMELFVREVERFLQKDSIVVEKKTKKRTSMIDIKPLVKKLKIEIRDNVILTGLLNAGGEQNLNPMLFLESLRSFISLDFEIINIKRTGLYILGDGELIEPV